MSVTINKPISKTKELFLAVCLLSGEISGETIRKMKEDYGETRIKNNIIQSLNKDGYIKKIRCKEGDYGYRLTYSGLDYLRTKFPDKYNYDWSLIAAVDDVVERNNTVRNLRNSWDSMTIQEKQRALRICVNRIVVYDNKIDIEYLI